MYVANTTYYSTPWVVPWMHTQLGSAGSAATGTVAGLRAMMRKGKMEQEPINVISFCAAMAVAPTWGSQPFRPHSSTPITTC